MNYELIRKKVEQSGAMDTWTKQVEATGELAQPGLPGGSRGRPADTGALQWHFPAGYAGLSRPGHGAGGHAECALAAEALSPCPAGALPGVFCRDALPLALLEKYTCANLRGPLRGAGQAGQLRQGGPDAARPNAVWRCGRGSGCRLGRACAALRCPAGSPDGCWARPRYLHWPDGRQTGAPDVGSRGTA